MQREFDHRNGQGSLKPCSLFADYLKPDKMHRSMIRYLNLGITMIFSYFSIRSEVDLDEAYVEKH